MSDQGATGGDIWIVPAEGGEPRNLTPGSSLFARLVDLGRQRPHPLRHRARRPDDTALVQLHSPARPQPRHSTSARQFFRVPASISDGRIKMSLSSTADHSLFVFQASGFDNPPEIVGVRPGNIMDNGGSGGFNGLMQLSNFNDGLKATSGKVHSLHWKNEGFNVQGWLREPDGFDPVIDAGKKFPLIVIVHGGPSSSVLPSWGAGSLGSAIFTKLGYFVLEPNPRGSYGEGEAFTQANIKDFGYGDLRDILAGVDAVEAKFPVDDKRVGLTGWSYGGFMTMFAITQTHRFRAAVAGAGISNWQSYYGENSIDQWMIPFFGASVYDVPAVYAKSSAINFIKNVNHPYPHRCWRPRWECPAPSVLRALARTARPARQDRSLSSIPMKGMHLASLLTGLTSSPGPSTGSITRWHLDCVRPILRLQIPSGRSGPLPAVTLELSALMMGADGISCAPEPAPGAL